MVAAGFFAWLSFLAYGDGDPAARAFGQALVELPAALAFTGVAAAAVALLPRAAIAISWAAYAIGIAIGLFGALLKLPKALIRISPFDHVPAVPFDDWGPTLILVAVDVVLVAGAVLLVRRRDLST
jgi:ABC-2 type transport system permease protein